MRTTRGSSNPDRTPQGPITSGIAAIEVLASILASGACAAVLHGALERPGAVALLPIAFLWGAVAVVGGRRLQLDWRWAVLVALLVRLPLVGTPPLLSDDVYRYLWEGLALLAGHDPFTEAPATIGGLDDALRSRVNHPSIPSIYPPVALAWFQLLAALGDTVPVAQALTALVDVAVVAAIGSTLASRGARSWPVWIYALHPLPALESASGAHLEVLAILAAVLAIRLPPGAAVFAAWIGVGTKLFPVVLLPTLYARAGREAVVPTIAALGLLLLLAAPVLDAGPGLLVGMQAYAGRWSFNGLVFPWIEPVLGGAARPLLVGIAAGICLVPIVRREESLRVWATAGAVFVLLSPTVHPWYVLWALVPSLLLGRLGWAVAAVFLIGSYSVLLAYDPTSGTWSEAPWLWWVTWPPALLALLVTGDLPLQLRRDASPTAPYPTVNNSRKGSDAR